MIVFRDLSLLFWMLLVKFEKNDAFCQRALFFSNAQETSDVTAYHLYRGKGPNVQSTNQKEPEKNNNKKCSTFAILSLGSREIIDRIPEN